MSLGKTTWVRLELRLMAYGTGDWTIDSYVSQGGEDHQKNFVATVPLASGTDRWIAAAELADVRGKFGAMAASLVASTLDACPFD